MLGRKKKARVPESELRNGVVRISREQIDEVFANAKVQDDYISGLYGLVIDGFAEAERVDGYPAANAVTDAYILSNAEAHDKSHGRAPGMGWLNYRWEIDSRLADWEVSVAAVRVVPKP